MRLDAGREDQSMGAFRLSNEEDLRKRRALRALLPLLMLALPVPEIGESRILTDQAGRTVTVPDDPRRVVSLAPSITEIVFALGEEDRLKGGTQHCDYPAEARLLPRVGSYVHLDLERIVALKPDLCIGVRDGNPVGQVKELEAFGIPVYAVDPRTLNTTINTVMEVGRLLNADQKAQHLAAEMRSRIELIRERVAKTNPRPRVFFQIGTAPLVSAGNNTIIDELIRAAGGQNLAAGVVPYPRFSREQVLALRPDIIIITSMTKGTEPEGELVQWRKYEELPAVQNQRIYCVSSDLFDRATPRLVKGLEDLAKLIHPELVP
jgi:iron complex transport system substrate-binding protein